MQNPLTTFEKIGNVALDIMNDKTKSPILRIILLMLLTMAFPYMFIVLSAFPEKVKTEQEYTNQLGFGIFVSCMILLIIAVYSLYL